MNKPIDIIGSNQTGPKPWCNCGFDRPPEGFTGAISHSGFPGHYVATRGLEPGQPPCITAWGGGELTYTIAGSSFTSPGPIGPYQFDGYMTWFKRK